MQIIIYFVLLILTELYVGKGIITFTNYIQKYLQIKGQNYGNKKFDSDTPNYFEFKNNFIYQFTRIELYVFSFLVGMMLTTFVSMFFVYLSKYSSIGTFVFNFIFIGFEQLISFISKKQIQFEKSRISSKRKEESIFLPAILAIMVVVYQYLNFRNFHENIDVFVYIHHSIDGIRYGWNFFDVNYLGTFYSSKMFNFFLMPFISPKILSWEVILKNFVTPLQMFLLFLLIFNFYFKYLQNAKYKNLFLIPFVILILLSGYLLTWMSYPLPSAWNILYVLVILDFLFLKSGCKNIGYLTLLFSIFFHFSTFVVLGIPLFLSIVWDNRKLIKKWHFLFKKSFYRHKIGYIAGILILSIIFSFIMKYFLIDLIKLYFSFERESVSYPISYWFFYTIGMIITAIFFICLFHFKKDVKIHCKSNSFTLFSLFFAVFLILYFIFYPFSGRIIRTLYLPYRFIVYFDLSIILLSCYVFSLISKKMKEKIFELGNILHNLKK